MRPTQLGEALTNRDSVLNSFILETSVKNRHRLILDFLETRGTCTYQELSSRFDVSTMTIRRDVDFLAQQGRVIKTLGGVQDARAPSFLFETPLHSRISTNREEKQAIAEHAIRLIEAGQTLFIDGSTTCLELARLINVRCDGLTIVTNSVLTCIKLGKSGNNMVVCVGGQFEKDTASFVGASAEETASKFFVDMALLSTKGFVPTEGTFESSIGNLRIKQIFAEQSANTVLLVDHSKFGVRALRKAIDISRISTVVTNRPLPAQDASSLRRQSKRVVIASAKTKTPKKALNAS
jgi:DeoR/GlpR family transcriptional regulator of sugar metabolism